jgi:hypothetical protein
MRLNTGVIIYQLLHYLKVFFTMLAEVCSLRFNEMPIQASLGHKQLVLAAWHCPARRDSLPVQFGFQYSARFGS